MSAEHDAIATLTASRETWDATYGPIAYNLWYLDSLIVARTDLASSPEYQSLIGELRKLLRRPGDPV